MEFNSFHIMTLSITRTKMIIDDWNVSYTKKDQGFYSHQILAKKKKLIRIPECNLLVIESLTNFGVDWRP